MRLAGDSLLHEEVITVIMHRIVKAGPSSFAAQTFKLSSVAQL